MVKKGKNINTLIKRGNLVNLLKKSGIKRVSPDSITYLEKYIEENLKLIIESLKEKTIINARKTLKKEDIKETIQENQINNFET